MLPDVNKGAVMERVRIVFMGQPYEVPVLSTTLQRDAT